jgi:hypothetical protein
MDPPRIQTVLCWRIFLEAGPESVHIDRVHKIARRMVLSNCFTLTGFAVYYLYDLTWGRISRSIE